MLQLGGAGIGGGGVSTGCPSIDLQDVFLGGILDDSVYELNKLLQFAKPPMNQHLKMIQNIFGIPYPFNQVNNVELPVYNADLDDSRDNKNANDPQHSKNHNSLYVESSLFGLIVDKSKYDPSEDSLLCKSVVKRRPDLVEELSFYDPKNLLVQPSMKYKNEEDEDDYHHADDNDNDNDNKNRIQIEPPQAHVQAKPSAKRRQTVRPEFKPEPTKMEDVFIEKDENELEDIHNEEKPKEHHNEIHTDQPEKPVEKHEQIPTEQPVVRHEEQQKQIHAEQSEQPAIQNEEVHTVQPEQHEEAPVEQLAENHEEQQKQITSEQPVVQNEESHTEQQTEQPIEQHDEPPAENHEEQQHEQIPVEQPEQPAVQQHEQIPVENHEEQIIADQPTDLLPEQHEEHPAE